MLRISKTHTSDWRSLKSGKTVLCSQIIQNSNKKSAVSFAYHFCDSRLKTSDLSGTILRSLIVQLVRQTPDIAPYIYAKYASGGAPPSRLKLDILIPEVLKLITCARIVVDGLDEYPEDHQSQILQEIVWLFSSVGTHCKVLFSSRETPRICKALKRKPTVSLSDRGKFVEKDIQLFIEHLLAELRGSWDSSTIDFIGKIMASKAKGKYSITNYSASLRFSRDVSLGKTCDVRTGKLPLQKRTPGCRQKSSGYLESSVSFSGPRPN